MHDIIALSLLNSFRFDPHPYGMRLKPECFAHGPKKHAPGMVFTSTSCWPPFRILPQIKIVGTAKAVPTIMEKDALMDTICGGAQGAVTAL